MGRDDQRTFHDASMSLPDGMMSFDAVEERLVAAMDVLLRSGDREQGWLHVSSMSLWRQIKSDTTETPADDRPMVTCAVTRHEVEQADEAMQWVARYVPTGDTRRIVGLALVRLALRGSERTIWPDVWFRMGGKDAGWTTDGLRKRYSRAVGGICIAINRAISDTPPRQ